MFYGSARFRYLIEFSFLVFSAHFFVVLFRRLAGKAPAPGNTGR
jgi:hypothetical protein